MKLVLVFLLAAAAYAADIVNHNRPERQEWYRDQGFGLFIHWGVDSQLGSVISHSLVGASEDYVQRYFSELPRTFNPRKFHPQDWAVLAKLAGVRYVMFTAKHHSGFCMFDTATTPFNVMRTPFGRDITRAVLDAFREQGIAPGLYYSPDDFWWLSHHGKTLQRNIPEVAPAADPAFLKYDQAQVREMLTHYGPVDLIFFDGPAEGLRDLAWEIRPDTVVTRGAIQTPEQYVPGVPNDTAWESCITMGTQWQYKPTNEHYKSGGQLIGLLIETRAKGGNLLLNVGPKPDGELPIEQEERLREIALWMFVNGEAIYSVRPWVITNEGEVWFTRKKNEDTVYAIARLQDRWKYGEWKDFTLRSVAATPETRITVLGQNDQVLEYRPDVTPKTTWRQEAGGLHIRAMHAQRLYNDRTWPNPVVLKITHAKQAFTPPRVETVAARRTGSSATLEGDLLDTGSAGAVEVGFEYRSIRGLDVNERSEPWVATAFVSRSAPGRYTVQVPVWRPGAAYEVRAVVRHPLLTIYGKELTVAAR